MVNTVYLNNTHLYWFEQGYSLDFLKMYQTFLLFLLIFTLYFYGAQKISIQKFKKH